VKTPKQTFSSPQIPYRASSIRLLPSDVTSIQLPPVGPSNSVFSSTHSSFRLDKVNSDMRNYITNFAADLRWIQAQRHPSAYLSVAAMLQWSDVGVRWLEQTLKTSQWEFTRGSQRILAKNEALFNTHYDVTLCFTAVCFFPYTGWLLLPLHSDLISGRFCPQVSLAVGKVDITLQTHTALLQHYKMDCGTFNHAGIFLAAKHQCLTL